MIMNLDPDIASMSIVYFDLWCAFANVLSSFPVYDERDGINTVGV